MPPKLKNSKQLSKKTKKTESKTCAQSNETKLDPNANVVYPDNSIEKLKDDVEAYSLAQKMDEMYSKLKTLVKTYPKFKEEPDKKKLDFFREKMGYNELMNDHPIVTRYLICMGQYSSTAFRKFLYKVKHTPIPPPDKREKGFMEDQWIRRQADYVRFLWESYQRKRFSHLEAQAIWQDTYTKLKGEFDDFRNMYKKTEDKVKEDKIKNSAENIKDLLERLKTGAQSLDENDQAELLSNLKYQLIMRRRINVYQELKKKLNPIDPKCTGVGEGKPDDEIENKDKQKITMIETVDEQDYDKIEAKYKAPTSNDKYISSIRQAQTKEYQTTEEDDIIVEKVELVN